MAFALVDCRITEKMKRGLLLHGFSVIEVPPCKTLGEAVSSHPDTLFFKLSKNIISSADYVEEAPYLFTDIHDAAPDIKIIISDDALCDKYPGDCAYNALVVGDAVFCREESVSSAVKELVELTGKRIVSTKQGYAACSTLALSERAAITADKGMSEALKKEGVTVYEIEAGHILLPPHKYGFIGGACGVFGDKVYFFGDYAKHPSRDVLELAMAKEGFTPISLSDEELVDLGGIVFLE